VYTPEIGEAHRSGDLHIHDLDMLSGYCAGWSLRTLLHEGLNGVPGKVEAGPARHMSSAVGQVVNFLGTLQNEWAGAQAFSSFDTYMAPFIRKDGMTYAQVRQCIQELVHNLNVPSRWGTQTPFTNLTFDWTCPDDLKEQVPVIAGEEMPFCYGDLSEEMDLINRAFIEVMTEGDAKGRVFTFPIPTYNITPDFPWESENAMRLFEMTAKYGLPYFQNFINSELEPNMVRSMCCRLQLDVRELLKRGNGLFGSAEQTGSLGVVTVNCARLGFLYRGRRGKPVRRAGPPAGAGQAEPGDQAQADPAADGPGPVPLHQALPRHAAQPLLDAGRERHQRDGAQLQRRRPRHHQRWGEAFALRLLDHVRERIVAFQEETGTCTTWRRRRPKAPPTASRARTASAGPTSCRPAPDAQPYYTNSSQLPVGFTDDPFRGDGAAGAAAVEVHRRHRAAPVHGRAACPARGLPHAGAARADELPPALHHHHADLLDLSHARLPGGEHAFCPKCDEERLAESARPWRRPPDPNPTRSTR
jgi:ribonucleoside-triphosphate reductase